MSGREATEEEILAAEARTMSDAEIREQMEVLRGNPKRGGRRLRAAEARALAALMAESAERARRG